MFRNISENFSYLEILQFACKPFYFRRTPLLLKLGRISCLLYYIVINEKVLKSTPEKSVKIFYVVILNLFLSVQRSYHVIC